MMPRNKETLKNPMEMVPGAPILKCLAHWRLAAYEGSVSSPWKESICHRLHLLEGHGTSKAQTPAQFFL